MISIFNRKELMITYSMKRQAEIKSLLDKYYIDYWTKTKNSSGYGRSYNSIGNVGQNMDLMYEYKIYVHKSDYEKAKAIIEGRI